MRRKEERIYLVHILDWKEKSDCYIDSNYNYDIYKFFGSEQDVIKVLDDSKELTGLNKLTKHKIKTCTDKLPTLDNTNKIDKILYFVGNYDEYKLVDVGKLPKKPVESKFDSNKYYFVNINHNVPTPVFSDILYDADIYEFDSKDKLDKFIKNISSNTLLKEKHRSEKISLAENQNYHNVIFMLTRKNGTFKLENESIVDNTIYRDNYSIWTFYPSGDTLIAKGEDEPLCAYQEMVSDLEFETWDVDILSRYFDDYGVEYKNIGKSIFSKEECYEEQDYGHIWVINTCFVSGVLSSMEKYEEIDNLINKNLDSYKKELVDSDDKEATLLIKQILEDIGVVDKKGNVKPKYKDALNNIIKTEVKTKNSKKQQ